MSIGPLGYLVLIRHDDRPGWHADWDGEVHPTVEAGHQALREARVAGYEAELTGLSPFNCHNNEEPYGD